MYTYNSMNPVERENIVNYFYYIFNIIIESHTDNSTKLFTIVEVDFHFLDNNSHNTYYF